MKKAWAARLVAALLIAVLLPLGALAAEGEIKLPNLSYIKQREIPDNEAMAFLKKMGIGWNLGNTFDATHDSYNGDEMDIESLWVGVKTKEDMIKMVKDAGFNTIRMPVSWHNHVDEEFNISKNWLDRVQEVVDWAIALDMYVILNTHHDVGKKYYYPNSENWEVSEKYVQRIWQQLAERFRDYDEHLIFESLNEPRLVGTEDEWVFNAGKATCQDAADCINKMNQVFVDTVRASGGNNAGRYLMVPGYAASVDGALTELFKLPKDQADNKIIVSVHAYTPYPFALQAQQDGGTDTFLMTDPGQTGEIIRFMNNLYKTYIANGIPVVIGEYGARNKDDNLQSRVNFAAFYCANASARNMPCVWWDNNARKGNGELFGLLNRKGLEWAYPEIINALVTFAGYDKIPADE
ncbi:MAG: glycoside hydrolase family 5 protein [Clostridiales bacterium]|nr:glycoside hydrolase family 5 protein [Clostridiales bacterium]